MKQRLLSILLSIILIVPINNLEGKALFGSESDNSSSLGNISTNDIDYTATPSDSLKNSYIEKRAAVLEIDNVFNRKTRIINNKDIIKNGDEYNLILDAYILEEKIVNKKPMDIVIVIDQSISMVEKIREKIYISNMKADIENYVAIYQDEYMPVIFDEIMNMWCIEIAKADFVPITPKEHENDETGYQVYYETDKLTETKKETLRFINKLRDDNEINGMNHRIVIMGTGSTQGIMVHTLNNGVGVKFNSLEIYDIKAALVDCSDSIIEKALDNINENKDLNESTMPARTILTALKIFDNNILLAEDRENMFIFMHDSPPLNEAETEFDHVTANWAIESAATIKSRHNAAFYSIEILSELNEYQKDFDLFMELISSNYKNAESMTNHGNRNEDKTDYYKSVNSILGIGEAFEGMLEDIGVFEEAEEPPRLIKEILSNQFKLSDSENAVRVFIENCTGIETSEFGEITYNFGERQEYLQANIKISGKEVEITGFDFIENMVGIRMDTTFGSRVVVEMDIEVDSENCFGGNNIFVNNIGSGLYSVDDLGLIMLTSQSDLLAVNVDIDYDVLDVNKHIYISESVDIYELIKESSPYIYNINGNNNKYIDIIYTLYSIEEEKLADFIITNGSVLINELELGSFKRITENYMEFVLECQIILVKPSNEHREPIKVLNDEVENQELSKNINIYVAKPNIIYSDIKCYLGATKNLLEGISENVTWEYRGNNEKEMPSGLELDTLNMPTLIYEFEISEGKGAIDGNIFVPEEGGVTYINILTSINIGENEYWDISEETVFTGNGENGYFIEVETCSLILINNTELNNLKSGKTFIVNIKGANGLEYRVVVEAQNEKAIIGLPIGDYTIKEEKNWNWRYILSDKANLGTITLKAEEGLNNKEIYLTGERNGKSWLAMDKILTLR
jgi:hypothetical protein